MDCAITNKDGWFRYRAAAIIIEEGCVLMARNDRDPYYYSVGGAVLQNESAEEAVMREVMEEAGVHYDIDRLVFIHENFFTGDQALVGVPCHEIALYFLMKPKSSKVLHDCGFTQTGVKEQLCWIPLDQLSEFKVYPTFFMEKLPLKNDYIEHIVTFENTIAE